MSQSKDTDLESLLTAAAAEEMQARRRATLYVALPVVIGLLLVGLSVYTVIKLDRRATELRGVSEALEGQITEAKENLRVTQEQTKEMSALLEGTLKQIEDAKKILEQQGNSQENAKKALRVLAKPPSGPLGDSPVVTDPPTKDGTSGDKPGTRAGKFTESTYTGKDRTSITVEIATEGRRVGVYYTLDGKSERLIFDGKSKTSHSFTFTLDRSKHNPSVLLINFTHYGGQGELVKGRVRLTDSNGASAVYAVAQRDPSTKTVTRAFKFFVE